MPNFFRLCHEFSNSGILALRVAGEKEGTRNAVASWLTRKIQAH